MQKTQNAVLIFQIEPKIDNRRLKCSTSRQTEVRMIFDIRAGAEYRKKRDEQNILHS